MMSMGERLRSHKRNRNIMLGGGILLMLAGWYAHQWNLLVSGLVLANGYGFFLMAYDKKAAINGRFRIPEASMLLIAALAGATGILLGMLVFRHKTKHWKFLLTVPLFFLLDLILFLTLFL